MGKVYIFLDIEGSSKIQQLSGFIVKNNKIDNYFDLVNPSFTKSDRYVCHRKSQIIKEGHNGIVKKFMNIKKRYKSEDIVWVGQSIMCDLSKLPLGINEGDLPNSNVVDLLKINGSALKDKVELYFSRDIVNMIMSNILKEKVKMKPHNALYDSLMGLIVYENEIRDFGIHSKILGYSEEFIKDEVRLHSVDTIKMLDNKDFLYKYSLYCPLRRAHLMKNESLGNNPGMVISEIIMNNKIVNNVIDIGNNVDIGTILRYNTSLEYFLKYRDSKDLPVSNNLNISTNKDDMINLYRDKIDISPLKIVFRDYMERLSTDILMVELITRAFNNMLESSKCNIYKFDLVNFSNNIEMIFNSYVYSVTNKVTDSIFIEFLSDNGILELSENKVKLSVGIKGMDNTIKIDCPINLKRAVYKSKFILKLLKDKYDIVEYLMSMEEITITSELTIRKDGGENIENQ